jgi:V/A-type H+-transporting ATPase subunit I
MTLRPVAAQWFELLADRRQLAEAMRLLAEARAAELEVVGPPAHGLLYADLPNQLEDVRELARRYAGYWPQPRYAPPRDNGTPLDRAERAITRLHAWAAAASPVIDRLEAAQRARLELSELQQALAAAASQLPDLHQLAHSGVAIAVMLLAGDERLAAVAPPAPTLLIRAVAGERNFLLALGRREELAAFATHLPETGAHTVPLPGWLPADRAAGLAEVNQRLAAVDEEIAAHRAALTGLAERHDIAAALGTISLVEWLGAHADEVQGTRSLAVITGWIHDAGMREVETAFAAAGIRYLLHPATPPVGVEPPLILVNGRWGRRFEVFTRLLGMPAGDSVDPSSLVGVLAPLLFGFMFGDVGQGALILAVGLIAGRHIEALRFLVPCGIAAMAFGLLFGSVFGLDGIVPALWFRPMAEPVRALAYGLAAGVVILTLGLLLAAVQAHWRRRALDWWQRDAGLLLGYAGLLAAPFAPHGLWLAAAGALWFVSGGLALSRRPGGEAAAMVPMHFVETLFQLLVNTVSFARVGAFALAHAGLSAAVVGIAEAAGGVGWWIALVLGNLLVVALEGLVVSIQTTRLMLFEFFVRFFAPGGRPFRPLAPPAVLAGPSLESLYP